MIVIRLPMDTKKRLKKLSKITGRSMSFYAREALRTHMDGFDLSKETDRLGSCLRRSNRISFKGELEECLDENVDILNELTER